MRKILFIVYFILIFCGILVAQDIPGNEFSTINVSLNYNQNILDDDLKEYWFDGRGGSLSFSTPFYIGEAGLGLDFSAIKSKSIRQPNYETFFMHIAWRQGLGLGKFVKLLAGVKFGSYIMLFNDVALSQFESNESELAIAATGQININLTGRISINFASEFLTVFTNKRMKIAHYGAGASYLFDSPKWLREALE
jgi:hypothetical protein